MGSLFDAMQSRATLFPGAAVYIPEEVMTMRRLFTAYNGPPAAWVKIVRRICRCCRKSKKMPTTRYCWPDGTALCDDCFRRDGPPEEFFSAVEDERLAVAAGTQPFNSSPRKSRSRRPNDRIPDFRAIQTDELQTGHSDYWST